MGRQNIKLEKKHRAGVRKKSSPKQSLYDVVLGVFYNEEEDALDSVMKNKVFRRYDNPTEALRIYNAFMVAVPCVPICLILEASCNNRNVDLLWKAFRDLKTKSERMFNEGNFGKFYD